ncbi:sensor histidine kinase [Neolewinella agarilytica]|uniref:sensor histidine kinase n=1 Tax=Neolewinella agarilytica TaxID=478744 RepID=UPI002352F0EA|nr:HAMP domain-containing sensor histidine kinase [Neolewinella agarilytica]
MKRLLYTFSFIMMLIAAFLGVWWVQSFNKDMASLRDQVEAEMNRMVTEDFVYASMRAILFDEEYHKSGVRLGTVKSVSSPQGSFHIERIERNRDGSPESAAITVFVDGREQATSHFFFEDKKISLEKLPETVRDSIQRKFGINLQPLFFPNNAGALKKEDRMVQISHVGRGSEVKAAFMIADYFPSLLLGLLPEFLFGFVLFGATGFAFSSAYRNLFEQEKQLRQKDALVANVAHELKTPIATVGVALEALNSFGADADPGRRQEYLAIGQAELRRLNHMADRAIDSLQAGDLSQRIQPAITNLSTSVSEAWRGLALRYHLPEDALHLATYGDVRCNVDPHYWHHLVYNLLDNACKYGGRPLNIDVMVSGQAHETVLTITDNGPGIPLEERDNIFERFYRIYRPGEGHAVKGHGLGLTFVRQVAHAHGGQVEVDNTADGGARFTVRIPRQESYT